eukprot:1149958-Pelagomonas_calceolata.AAC.3
MMEASTNKSFVDIIHAHTHTCKTGGQPHMRGSLGWVQLTFPASIVCIKLAASLHEGIPLLLPLIKLPLTAGRGAAPPSALGSRRPAFGTQAGDPGTGRAVSAAWAWGLFALRTQVPCIKAAGGLLEGHCLPAGAQSRQITVIRYGAGRASQQGLQLRPASTPQIRQHAGSAAGGGPPSRYA